MKQRVSLALIHIWFILGGNEENIFAKLVLKEF